MDLKYEMIGSNLRITARASGDKLRPVGRGCTKSLKALFMERKYDNVKLRFETVYKKQSEKHNWLTPLME